MRTGFLGSSLALALLLLTPGTGEAFLGRVVTRLARSSLGGRVLGRLPRGVAGRFGTGVAERATAARAARFGGDVFLENPRLGLGFNATGRVTADSGHASLIGSYARFHTADGVLRTVRVRSTGPRTLADAQEVARRAGTHLVPGDWTLLAVRRNSPVDASILGGQVIPAAQVGALLSRPRLGALSGINGGRLLGQ